MRPDPIPPLPKPPARYVPKERCVKRHHAFFLLTHDGDRPSLKELAASCAIAPASVYRWCVLLNLPLSQTRPRRMKARDREHDPPREV